MSNTDHDGPMTASCAGIHGEPVPASGEFIVARGDPAGGRSLAAGSDMASDSEPNAARIGRFLAAHKPALYCDACIADRVGLSHRREANRFTSTLGKSPYFWRAVGACSVCQTYKQVIRHA